jgi:hypothetical protein
MSEYRSGDVYGIDEQILSRARVVLESGRGVPIHDFIFVNGGDD